MFDLSQMDGSTLQALLDAAQKKKEPTMMDRSGAAVSAVGQGVSQLGAPGQFYRRGADGSLNPQGEASGGGGGGGAAAGAATDPETAKKRAKFMKGLLAKIFKSKFSPNEMPVDIRPPEGDRAVPQQYASNDPFRFGGMY